MAERNGPEGHDEHNSVESGQHDDHSRVEDTRDIPAGSLAGEGTELIDNRQSADAVTGSDTAHDDTTTHDESADVLAFRPRDDEASAADEDDASQPANDDASDDLFDAGEIGDEPMDLAALQADDALLDALGGADPDVRAYAGSDDPGVEALLVAWRRDVDATPMGELVDTDSAAAVIVEGGRSTRRWRKRWHLVPVASAAAVLMITFTGVGLAARDALPGDMLWGVAQVLYTDHARSAQAADSAQSELDKASYAWQHGDSEAAWDALRRAQEQMKTVDAEHGRSELQAKHESLTARLEDGSQETSESNSSSASSTSDSSLQPTPPPPPPSEVPLPPPPPPSSTTPTTPSTSPNPTEPTDPSSSPTSATDSSNPPSSGTSWGGGGSSEPGLFPPSP